MPGTFNLSGLETLDLKQNKISQLHGAFTGLYNLKELRLNSNNISSLPEIFFKDLKNLRKIFLGNNLLKIIHGETFATNSQLKLIGLLKNKITAIENSAFEGLSLESLDLRQNPCFNDSNVITKFLPDLIKECIQGYETSLRK